MDPQLIHDLVKDLIGALVVWFVSRQTHKVGKFVKDLNCFFDRVRKLERRVTKLDHKDQGCDKDDCDD